MVEQKYADPYKQSNHVHLLVTSNEKWVVPVGLGDRRWAIFDVNDEVAHGQPGHDEYWAPIIRALHDGTGPACLLNYLKQGKYDRASLSCPPMTQAKADQAYYSLDPLEKWWLEALKGEQAVWGQGDDDVFGTEVPKDDVYRNYTNWHSGQNIRGRLTPPSEFWKCLRMLTGALLQEARPRDASGERRRVVQFPPRANCQYSFAQAVQCEWGDLESW